MTTKARYFVRQIGERFQVIDTDGEYERQVMICRSRRTAKRRADELECALIRPGESDSAYHWRTRHL